MLLLKYYSILLHTQSMKVKSIVKVESTFKVDSCTTLFVEQLLS